VTDANVALGLIGANALAGGLITIDAALAIAAIESTISSKVGGGFDQAAYGVRMVANAHMARAIKAVSTFKGRDPRRATLICYGGNGGIHGPDLARTLGIRTVIVPPAAGVFSALGLLAADPESSRIVPFRFRLADFSHTAIVATVARLRPELEASLGSGDQATISCAALMRFEGQGYELEVPVPLEPVSDLAARLREDFAREHLSTYGHVASDVHAVEIASLRVRLRGKSAATFEKVLSGLSLSSGIRPSRRCYFGSSHGWIETPVVERGQIGEHERAGPIVIEDFDGTTAVPPDAQVKRDRLNNIVITTGEAHAGL
jgi:N-methylhydantoinase A